MTFFAAAFVAAQVPVREDPLLRMPGSQPPPENSVAVDSSHLCMNCHAEYDPPVEPGLNWHGSMMAQAARDFLFYACLTVAAQDSLWAIGSPNATDLCWRCHTPTGWLGGRSDPTNGSALSGADFDGVSCAACHLSWDPFFATTFDGSREGGADPAAYWDETDASATPSGPAAQETYLEDLALSDEVRRFDGEDFFVNGLPWSPAWDEAGGGQYFLSGSGERRGPFADANANHQMLYSRFHKSRYFCGTCHDVSNPVLANLGADPAQPLPSESLPAHALPHVERTFSEFMLSAYSQGAGAPGLGPFAPEVFDTSNPGDLIARCQDCHLRDVSGKGADKNSAVLRPDESVEHPRSGLPLHDLAGGNAWVPTVLASAVPGSPNHDPLNEALLDQGPAALTLDLGAGLGLDPEALLSGADRARQQLSEAAAIEAVKYRPATGRLSFQIRNQTGHKLPSGFAEGRRLWVNVRVWDDGVLVYEMNPYDAAAGTLKGLDHPYVGVPEIPLPEPLAAHEVHRDRLVFEMHPSSSLTGEEKTFHFVLADERYKDNRIPPQGFRIDEASERLAQPRWRGQDAPNLFRPDEYAGGFTRIRLVVPVGADQVEISLLYQTTSREYVEFLRNEIAGSGPLTLPPEAYVAATDPFFDGLRAWGDTLWQLWVHNRDLDGAAPITIAQASIP